MPTDWERIVGKKFSVIHLKGTDVRDYKGHFSGIYKKSVQTKKDKFMVSKCKVLKYATSHRHEMQVSEQMSRDLTVYHKIQKPMTTVSMPTIPFYVNDISVKKEKIQDVMKLCKYLSPEAASFYYSLKMDDVDVDADSE